MNDVAKSNDREPYWNVEIAGLRRGAKFILHRLQRRRSTDKRVAGCTCECQRFEELRKDRSWIEPKRKRYCQNRYHQEQNIRRKIAIRKRSEDGVDFRTELRNLRRDERDDADGRNQIEPVEDHDADGLDVLERPENGYPRAALAHYHAGAKDDCKYDHPQTVV